MAKYKRYKAVDDRLKASVKHAKRISILAIERQMNEAQTTDVVEDVLEKMLNFDRFEDRKPQFNIDGKSKNVVDILLEFGDGMKVPVEIKQAAMSLNERHAGQLEDYAKLLNAPYGILTNGSDWRLIRYSPDDGDVQVAQFNLANDTPNTIIETAYVFTKESMKGGHTDKQAELAAFLQAENIADTLVSDRVLSAIRTEMKARHGCTLDTDDIRNVLMGEVVRPQLLGPAR